MHEDIEVRGAREHNLREVSLTIPKNKLVVFTGVSGSGKSSLAFDTLYAEGQRRYIESLSSYARQFLGQMHKPDVDALSGLCPSISIEQKTGAANPRSTVGTITEIHDYLRVLFARIGDGFCPVCGQQIQAQSREQILARIFTFEPGTQLLILAPVVRNQKGEFKDFFDEMTRRGYVRARVDGQVVRLTDRLQLDRQMRHNIEIVVDRIRVEEKSRARVAEAIEAALNLAEGSLIALPEGAGGPDRQLLLSARYACVTCNLSFPPPSPQLFSFNSPTGMCPACDGLGKCHTFVPELLVPEPEKSIREGAIETVGNFREMGRWRRHIYEGVAEAVGFSLDTAWQELTESQRRAILHGTGDQHITFAWRSRGRVHYHGGTWDGVIPQLLSKYKKTSSPMHRAMYQKYMRVIPCNDCGGTRLNPQARNVRIAGKTLIEVEAMPIDDLVAFFDGPLDQSITAVQRTIAVQAIREIRARLGFLINVGLHYLSLDRAATTLSGGEAQRIRLAGQIGSGLVGVLYVLDEPSIGLHPRDNSRLLASLAQLRDQGNTVLVVEHDEETMRAADHLVDFGPGPGVRGGEVVAQGSLDDILAEPRSVTGQYLRGTAKIEVPQQRRPVDPATAPKIKPAHAKARRSSKRG